MFGNQYFGSNYFYDFYWGPNVVTGGGKLPTEFLEFLFKRGKVTQEEKEALDVVELVPELKEEIELIQYEYDDFIATVQDIPEYETEIRDVQEEKFLAYAKKKIEAVKEKVKESDISIEFIVALLASDLDTLEVALVISQCLE